MNRPALNLLIHQLVDAARRAVVNPDVYKQKFLEATMAVSEALDEIEDEIENEKWNAMGEDL